MKTNEQFLRNIALCAFFHKRNLCHGRCMNCPQEVLRTISFETQGDLFETVIDAISSVAFLSNLEQKSTENSRITGGETALLEPFMDRGGDISAIMKSGRNGVSGFNSILIANYLNEDVEFSVSQNGITVPNVVKALSGLKIQIDPEKEFEYMIAGTRKHYKYRWLYCGELEVDIFGADGY